MNDSAPVDIILPIYGNADDLERCLESVRRYTDLGRHRLVLVVDGPQTEAVSSLVAEAEADGAHVERLPARSGFAAAVNCGLDRSERDVVLLNSDTETTAGWVEKLQRAAHSAADIATATPFSNNATICSVPRFLEENTLPAGHSVDTFGALVERCSERRYPDLPTGVGFCLYVRRDAAAAVGAFDDERFGLGYGEETSFCLRATAAGFRHVLDDATFVFHAGQGSFGAEGAGRRRDGERRLRRLHPAFRSTVAQFIRADPLAPVRARVTKALPGRSTGGSARPRKVVHVVHGWPPFDRGGTELYASWLVRRQAARREVAVYARIAAPKRTLGDMIEHHDRGVRVRLAVNNFDQRNPFSRNALDIAPIRRDFARFLDEERPDLLHVHHLAGHGASLLADLPVTNVPVLYQLQDWWSLCARVNLHHRDGGLCSGPSPGKCSACRPLTRMPPAGLWSRLLHIARRRRLRRALRRADGYLMGSEAVAESHRRFGLIDPTKPTWTLDYGIELDDLGSAVERPDRADATPLRCGVVGAVMRHKGVHLAVQALARIDASDARLEIWGSTSADPEYVASLRATAPAHVQLRGPFDNESKREILSGLDLLLVPSIGLESFGLTAREALHCGAVVVAARRGGLADLPDGRGVVFFEPESTESLEGQIRHLVTDPERLSRLRAARRPVKGMVEHVEEVERIYSDLLGAAE